VTGDGDPRGVRMTELDRLKRIKNKAKACVNADGPN